MSNSINEISKNINNVSVYPNPFDHSLNTSLNLKNNAWVKIELTDIYGRNIFSENQGFLNAGMHELSISNKVENLADAVYLLRIQANDDILIKKVIKN